jgi:predicted RNA-binding protein with TRAM domain
MMKRLKEGEEYEFRVEKKLSGAGDLDKFILQGPDAKKYLLPADVYRHYGIKTGTIIKCRVDKISCKGEFFLEPRNPFYSEGKSYEFIVAGHDIRTDSSGNELNVFLVKDLHGKLVPVPCKTFPAKGSAVRLSVERISKGRLFIYHKNVTRRSESLSLGKFYNFRVERTGIGIDGDEYFILVDDSGDTHTISKSNYEYYGFSPGDTIRGKVVKYKRSGEKIIEPENPYYKPGRYIALEVIGYTRNSVNDSFTLDLADKYGFTHCIETKTLPVKETLRCRVKMIKKGKPLLVLL